MFAMLLDFVQRIKISNSQGVKLPPAQPQIDISDGINANEAMNLAEDLVGNIVAVHYYQNLKF